MTTRYRFTFLLILFKIGFFILFGAVSCNNKQFGDPEEQDIEKPLFRLRKSAETGITFTNVITEDRNRNIIRYQGYYDGGGVAAADFNNDGLIDLYFTANMYPNRYYVNKGQLRFEDQTESAGLKEEGFGWYTGVTVVDINNDGWMDIYVCKSGMLKEENRRNILYVNNGDGTFTDKAAAYGLDHAGYSTHAAFFDYDRDGDLDMYLTNYGVLKGQFRDEETLRLRSERDEFNGDKFFEQVDGRYIDITKKAGLADHKFGFAHSVGIGDFDGNGWDDIYVCNDFFEADYLYFNQGDKTFKESMANAMNHISNFSMGNDVADFNNDGLPDIVVLDMVAEDNRRMKENMSGMDQRAFDFFVNLGFHHQYMFNMLHLNNGNKTFSEIAHLAGISNTDWSWAPLFADFDNDGHKDLYITNGLKRDARNLTAKYEFEEILRKAAKEGRSDLTDEEWNAGINGMPSERLKNYMFQNNGDLTFKNVVDAWGLGYASFSNGAAYADLDNDGDLDLIVNNISDPAFIFENTLESNAAGFLIINLIGPPQNRDGVGAKLELYCGETKQFLQRYYTRGYRSAMAGGLHFGLGNYDLVDSLRIIWPDGKIQVRTAIEKDKTISIDYSDATISVSAKTSNGLIFEDYTRASGLRHFYTENEFDDFSNQELLPYKISALGPALAVGDVNGDGLEDVFIGGSRGFPSSVYQQLQDGKFKLMHQPDFHSDRNYEDGGAAFFDLDGDGDLDLYIATGGAELLASDQGYRDRLYVNDGTGVFRKNNTLIPEMRGSNSCVIPLDYDRDGDLDLFVGGRQVPGKYPFPASSRLLRNDGNRLVDVTNELIPDLNNIGMVTSAALMDYDKDGLTDLLIAGEWMSVMLFRNEGNRFVNVTEKAGLNDHTGLWQQLVVADFDKDGDMDFVAGNLGLNSKFKATLNAPFEVFAGDFDQNGTHDMILSHWEGGRLFPVRDRLTMIRQFPFIETAFPTFESFARATIQDIFKPEVLESNLHLKTNTMASAFFSNNGDGTFAMKPLPNAAQISGTNTLFAEDVDRDGNLDLIVAGNIFGLEAETVRNDAGYGMFLKGDGKGLFVPVHWPRSGLSVAGDVKCGVAVQTTMGKLFIFGKNNDFVQIIK